MINPRSRLLIISLFIAIVGSVLAAGLGLILDQYQRILGLQQQLLQEQQQIAHQQQQLQQVQQWQAEYLTWGNALEALQQNITQLQQQQQQWMNTSRLIQENAIRQISQMPVGSVVAFAGSASQIPADWLLCAGQALHKADYPELYAVLGITHGAGYNAQSLPTGDFNVPDYRGLFLRGVDLGRGLDPGRDKRQAAAIGGAAGDTIGSIQASSTALPQNPWVLSLAGEHDHRNEAYNNLVYANGREVAPVQNTINKLWGDAPNLSNSRPMRPAGEHTHAVSGGDAETRPINVSVYWIIKAR